MKISVGNIIALAAAAAYDLLLNVPRCTLAGVLMLMLLLLHYLIRRTV